MDVRFYHTGFCTHPACMVERGAGLGLAKFPASVVSIRHQTGMLLFDTGYAPRFFAACRQFPERLYALTTPVTLNRPTIAEQLGEDAMAVDTVFLSHLHADHIAGLKDFPHANILLSRQAYDYAMQPTARIWQVRQGFLADLLPDDFAERAVFIEDLPKVTLASDFYPFDIGYQVAPELIAIPLLGHAAGHYGLLAGEFFLVGDAVWRFASIHYDRLPHPLTQVIVHDAKLAKQTVRRLQILHQQNPQLWLVPSHCVKTLRYLGVKGLE